MLAGFVGDTSCPVSAQRSLLQEVLWSFFARFAILPKWNKPFVCRPRIRPTPYGSIVKWPESPAALTRSVGASVILVNGALAAYVSRGEKQLALFLPEDEPTRSMVARAIAASLAEIVSTGRRRAMLITEVDGAPVTRSPLAPFLAEAGFVPGGLGYQMRANLR
jgi:hypothetical protein